MPAKGRVGNGSWLHGAGCGPAGLRWSLWSGLGSAPRDRDASLQSELDPEWGEACAATLPAFSHRALEHSPHPVFASGGLIHWLIDGVIQFEVTERGPEEAHHLRRPKSWGESVRGAD